MTVDDVDDTVSEVGDPNEVCHFPVGSGALRIMLASTPVAAAPASRVTGTADDGEAVPPTVPLKYCVA